MPETKRAPETAISEAHKQEDDATPWLKSWAELFAQSKEAYHYSVKAWYTQRRARTHGTDPNDSHSPGFLGPDGTIMAPPAEYRIAAAMCDIQRNRYSAAGRLSLLDLYSQAEKVVGETKGEQTRRLKGSLYDQAIDVHTTLRLGGLPSVFDLAELTHEERIVVDLALSGRPTSDIMQATGKAHGTVDVLRARGLRKLRSLAQAQEGEAAVA